MLTIRELLSRKRTQELCTIDPDSSVFEAIKILSERNLGALLVTQQNKLLGVFTERDYARNVILKGRSSRTTRVHEIMSKDVVYATRETTIEQCMALMLTKYIRHLPILEHQRLIGIVSMGDIVKASLGEKEFMINELIAYITDTQSVSQQRQHYTDHAALSYSRQEF